MIPVSAVLVTRGDVDLSDIIDSITASGIEDIVVWDNSKRDDLAVYGRYAAIADAKHNLIFVQDDDVLLPPESIQALIGKWEELAEGGVTDVVVANMPEIFRHVFYETHCLVGFGAVFHRNLPDLAFTRFGLSSHRAGSVAWGENGVDQGFFDRTCDIVFTGLTPRVLMDVGYQNLPWALSSTRMWKQRDHITERGEMLKLVWKARDGT